MSERTLTNAGARALANWLRYCVSIGWPKGALTRLGDLWIEYHDEYGKPVLPVATDPTDEVQLQAADEIERLRGFVQKFVNEIDDYGEPDEWMAALAVEARAVLAGDAP